MGVLLWCTAVPVVMFIFRKYRNYTWGHCKDVRSLQNKVFIVTGASSGLGKETVKELAQRKARVIMACRDLLKAEDVISEIRSEIKTGELIPMELDLARVESVKKFAAEVIKDFPRIDVLINNAGVSVPPSRKKKTLDGFEINFGTNHLGHFCLTNLLLDRLVASAPSRIVIVTSSLHEGGVIDFDNLQGEKGFPAGRRNPAYNNSKLANVYFCRELAERLPSNVQTFAVCPGFCYTDLFRHTTLKWYHYVMFSPIAFFFMRSASKGCQTILHCAVSEELNGLSGQLFRDCRLYKPNITYDDKVQKKLWNVSEQLVSSVTAKH
uniref:Retinol dehydrogenase 12 n=1 Tax=Lygus hesperus TaxID=30085 RepID=A0A0K8SB02_LYGHE